ncbi:MAG: LysR family transcriptional regulator [Pseudomonadota bacterium]
MEQPTTQRIPLLDLDLLRTLVAIADNQSFSAAAKDVGRTPSAVSMQVKRIEDLVGRPVFLRDSRSVSLTPDGAYLVDHARQMLSLNHSAMERFMSPGLTGVVRLGAPDDVSERFLPDMLRRFAATHPGVTIDVVVDETKQLVADVKSGRLDMTLMTCDAEIKKQSGLEVLFVEQLVWATLRGGAAATKSPLPLSVWQEGCAWREAGLEALSCQGRAWRIAFQSAHISGQRAAILADLAIAPIPVASITGDIVEVPDRYGLPILPRYALALMLGDKPNPAIDAAADHLRAAFASARNRFSMGSDIAGPKPTPKTDALPMNGKATAAKPADA